MRRILPALMLLPVLMFGSAAWAADTWTQFKDPNHLFTVDLPSAPQVDHPQVQGSDGKPVPSDEYTVEHGNSALLVVVGDFTRFTDTTAVLDAAVKGISALASKDLSDKPNVTDGQAGREVRFIDKDGNKFDDVIFLHGGRMYQIMSVLAPNADAQTMTDADRFQTSFRFVGK